MKPNLLFRFSGIFFFINGIVASLFPDRFFYGTNFVINPNEYIVIQSIGLVIILLGLVIFRMPLYVGNTKVALTTVLVVHAFIGIVLLWHLLSFQASLISVALRLSLKFFFIALYIAVLRKT